MDKKLDVCRRYIFAVNINDQSMDRVDLHHEVEKVFGVEKDNIKMMDILHNLDIHIGLPIDIGLDIETIKRYEKKLYNLLNNMKNWETTDKEAAKMHKRETDNILGRIRKI